MNNIYNKPIPPTDYLLLDHPIYIYIFIVIHRQICFVQSEHFSEAWHISFPELEAKPGWLKRQSKLQPRGASSSEVNFKLLWITITIVYINPFNGYWDLNSSMKRLAINTHGNAITSFAGQNFLFEDIFIRPIRFWFIFRNYHSFVILIILQNMGFPVDHKSVKLLVSICVFNFSLSLSLSLSLSIYIYIYILNNSPYGKKKTGKWFEAENIQRISAKGEKYISEKKEKANFVIPIKKIKRHAIGWSKDKKHH